LCKIDQLDTSNLQKKLLAPENKEKKTLARTFLRKYGAPTLIVHLRSTTCIAPSSSLISDVISVLTKIGICGQTGKRRW
jgi:hypothetical protein